MKSLETEVLFALAMLRRRINPRESPIYRLYPEFLPHIASHLMADDLVKASHISYHWRTVLLTHLNLWSTLDFANPQRTSTSHDPNQPRSTSSFRKAFRSSLSLESLEQSAERIATLQAGDYSRQKELLLRTMPSLRTFEFYIRSGDSVLVEETRLSSPAPKTLFFYGTDCPLFFMPRLTRICSLDGFLGFLSSCPLLEELEIFNVGDFYTQHYHGSVHLPHLRAYTHHTTRVLPPSCPITFSSSNRCYKCDRCVPVPSVSKAHFSHRREEGEAEDAMIVWNGWQKSSIAPIDHSVRQREWTL